MLENISMSTENELVDFISKEFVLLQNKLNKFRLDQYVNTIIYNLLVNIVNSNNPYWFNLENKEPSALRLKIESGKNNRNYLRPSAHLNRWINFILDRELSTYRLDGRSKAAGSYNKSLSLNKNYLQHVPAKYRHAERISI